MAIKFDYFLSKDFLNQKASIDSLEYEIRSSSITIALDHICLEGNACAITFKADLTDAEKKILDDIVSAHEGSELNVPMKISITLDNQVQFDAERATVTLYCKREES